MATDYWCFITADEEQFVELRLPAVFVVIDAGWTDTAASAVGMSGPVNVVLLVSDNDRRPYCPFFAHQQKFLIESAALRPVVRTDIDALVQRVVSGGLPVLVHLLQQGNPRWGVRGPSRPRVNAVVLERDGVLRQVMQYIGTNQTAPHGRKASFHPIWFLGAGGVGKTEMLQFCADEFPTSSPMTRDVVFCDFYHGDNTWNTMLPADMSPVFAVGVRVFCRGVLGQQTIVACNDPLFQAVLRRADILRMFTLSEVLQQMKRAQPGLTDVMLQFDEVQLIGTTLGQRLVNYRAISEFVAEVATELSGTTASAPAVRVHPMFAGTLSKGADSAVTDFSNVYPELRQLSTAASVQLVELTLQYESHLWHPQFMRLVQSLDGVPRALLTLCTVVQASLQAQPHLTIRMLETDDVVETIATRVYDDLATIYKYGRICDDLGTNDNIRRFLSAALFSRPDKHGATYDAHVVKFREGSVPSLLDFEDEGGVFKSPMFASMPLFLLRAIAKLHPLVFQLTHLNVSSVHQWPLMETVAFRLIPFAVTAAYYRQRTATIWKRLQVAMQQLEQEQLVRHPREALAEKWRVEIATLEQRLNQPAWMLTIRFGDLFSDHVLCHDSVRNKQLSVQELPAVGKAIHFLPTTQDGQLEPMSVIETDMGMINCNRVCTCLLLREGQECFDVLFHAKSLDQSTYLIIQCRATSAGVVVSPADILEWYRSARDFTALLRATADVIFVYLSHRPLSEPAAVFPEDLAVVCRAQLKEYLPRGLRALLTPSVPRDVFQDLFQQMSAVIKLIAVETASGRQQMREVLQSTEAQVVARMPKQLFHSFVRLVSPADTASLKSKQQFVEACYRLCDVEWLLNSPAPAVRLSHLMAPGIVLLFPHMS
eukprot:TRINITY_DN1038_c0_g2_i2.p1 TRINITY_DN1038_c0_g2~~TRINITY_DN1038_c0_g2_i2.p1  ORF type:complete len:880 (-),score=167.33 TRINITY_DN1038_c0_g2_i2:144-2783(-)